MEHKELLAADESLTETKDEIGLESTFNCAARSDNLSVIESVPETMGLTVEERDVLLGASEEPTGRIRQGRGFIRLFSGGMALIVAGFIMGQVVLAVADPGSPDDPLITKSFFEKILGDNSVQVHNQIVALNQRIETLQKALEKSGTSVQLPPMPANYQNTPWTVAPSIAGATVSPVLINGPVDGSVANTNASSTAVIGSVSGGVTGTGASTAVSNGKPQGMVNSSTGANVRYGPGMDYTVVCVADHGTLLTILETKAGSDGSKWYRVTLPDGREGFIRQDLVTLKN
ncbi:SH3 domain-containing protein [Heliobacillus mobilis]|uniref:SH3 domain-containing protein n=1 Tax=Heliobacterium mobile TaxID=28064 RepID=A0A6I3SLU3_HELMO|nr:SH3 domain-containing protein [Heliobacterium mobile]MTV49914.1 SH3 domain-containing protein [Heliobacterium mobile]